MKKTNQGKWHIFVSPRLKPICKTLAAAQNKKVGDFISDILLEKLCTPEVEVNGIQL